MKFRRTKEVRDRSASLQNNHLLHSGSAIGLRVCRLTTYSILQILSPTSPRTTCGPPSPPARSCTGRARDRRPAARPRVFGRIVDVRSRASAPPLRLCIRFKRANSLPKVPMPAAHHLTCLGRATPSCRGAHQTSMPHGHRELPDHLDCGHTAAYHTLRATLVQG